MESNKQLLLAVTKLLLVCSSKTESNVFIHGNGYRTYLISETETISEDDKVHTPMGIGTYLGIKDGIHRTKLDKNFNDVEVYHCMDGVFKDNHVKVMALPEQFSESQLKLIEDEKYKYGSDVLLEVQRYGSVDEFLKKNLTRLCAKIRKKKINIVHDV